MKLESVNRARLRRTTRDTMSQISSNNAAKECFAIPNFIIMKFSGYLLYDSNRSEN